MKTSIYIASERLEVIGYEKTGKNTKILEYISSDLSEGTMFNGKIMDSGELVEKFSSLKAEKPHLFKNASLVIDGNAMITKKILAPKLKKQQYNQLVKEEIGGTTENFEDYIFGYSVLDTAPGKEGAVLGCATDKTTIESYQSIFTEAGIPLTAIMVGLEVIINYVKSQPGLTEKNIVVNIVDGFSLFSIIFEKGDYIFSTRTRLMGEEQESFLMNVLESLSPLIQFNKSQQIDDIGASYYLGLNPEQVDFMKKNNTYTGLEILSLDLYGEVPGHELITDPCHFAYMGIFPGKEAINLLLSYKNIEKNQKEVDKRMPFFIALGVVGILLIGIFAYPTIQTMFLNNQIKEAETYLQSEEVVTKSAEIDKVNDATAKINGYLASIEEKKTELSHLPKITPEILNTIMTSNAGVVTVNSFKFEEETGTLHVIGSSATENNSSDYVNILKKSPLISDVFYTGYSYDNTKERRFNFAIDVVLKYEKPVEVKDAEAK